MCDEAERRLQYLINKSKELKVEVNRPHDLKTQDSMVTNMCHERQIAEELLFDKLDQEIIEKEKYVHEQMRIIGESKTSINKQVDYAHALTFVANQVKEIQRIQMQGGDMGEQKEPLLNTSGNGLKMSFVAGTIKNGEDLRMNRMLFRVTRGQALTYFGSVNERFTQDNQEKIPYLVVFQEMLRDRVQKVCDSFMGSRFEIPDLNNRLFDTLDQVRSQVIEDKNN